LVFVICDLIDIWRLKFWVSKSPWTVTIFWRACYGKRSPCR